jgi:methylglutaconyl-CoA hydratase
MAGPVEVSVDAGVARVSLNRPEVHNAFDDEMITSITDAFEALHEDSSARVVVMAGEGSSFCAGADAGWMRRMAGYTLEENIADARSLSRMLRAVSSIPKPVIARVQGAAFGGGVGLVAACDVAVATERATFALSEVRLGLVPATISPFVMARIGTGPMRRYALTGERFDAHEAHRIGLISEVVEAAEELDPRIDAIIGELRRGGPGAIAACKRLIEEVSAVDDRIHDANAQRIAEIRASDEGQEGLEAFLNKRPARWT